MPRTDSTITGPNRWSSIVLAGLLAAAFNLVAFAALFPPLSHAVVSNRNIFLAFLVGTILLSAVTPQNTLARIVVYALTPVVLYGIVQRVGADWSSWTNLYPERSHAGAGNANHLAAIALLVWIAVIWQPKPFPRSHQVFIGSASVLCLLATGSRLAMVLWAVSIVVHLGAANRRTQRTVRLIQQVCILALIAGVLVADRLLNPRFDVVAALQDGSVIARLEMWSRLPAHLTYQRLVWGGLWTPGQSVDNELLDLVLAYGLPVVLALGILVALGGLCIKPPKPKTSIGMRIPIFALFFVAELPQGANLLGAMLTVMLLASLASSLAGDNLDLYQYRRLAVPVSLGILGLGLYSPLKPPDSPGPFPYPPSSPIPIWISFHLTPATIGALAIVGILSVWALACVWWPLFKGQLTDDA